jgi:hypothetical protein
VGGGRLPASELVGDELLDVLTPELAGEQRLTVGLAVCGEQPDGIVVGLDGPGLLFSASRVRRKLRLRTRRWPHGSCRSSGTGWVDDIVPLIRVWWSGWLTAACSG